MAQQEYSVLIVDDSEDDRFLLRRAIGRFPRFVVVGEASDGEEAIAYLEGRGSFADRIKYPLPELMLLDLKMPQKNGFEVLQWLAERAFPKLTVAMLSSSPWEDDIAASIALGAHGYWTKTADPDKQKSIAEEIVALLDRRWFARHPTS